MKRICIVLFCYFFFYSASFTQTIDFENFPGISSAGDIPEDFTKLSSQKFNEDKETIEDSYDRRVQKDKENFLLESNFLMDEILHSGRVTFGDPVTNYLNQIKDIILKNDPETKNAIKIYTLLSNEVNAFTSDNGIVLVTTGLIAQAENEAQVAFILCHEFNHYIKKHAINNYVENKKIERGNGIYKSLNPTEVDLEKFKYSKELETEADDMGFKLFEKTNYSLKEVEGVFDVLLYSYLPFDEIEFKRNYFNDNKYILPDTYFLDTLNSITAEEDYDDEESTHPNIKKRKELILSEIKKSKDEDRKAFILPQAEFYYIQKVCRYQGCSLYLSDIEYEDAIYQAYLLQQEDHENRLLKNTIASALYGLSMYENVGTTPEWHKYYKKVEGNSQQVFHLMYKIKQKELNILALKNAWEAHLLDPENEQMFAICKQLGDELVNKNDTELKDFYSLKQIAADSLKNSTKNIKVEIDTVSTSEEKTETAEKSNKYEKIKKGSSKEEVAIKEVENEYWRFAFAKFIDDPEFKELFDVKEKTIIEDDAKSGKKYKKPEFQLGVDEIVIVDPIYLRIDERNKNPVQYEAAESAKLELKNKIYESADELDLKVQYADRTLIEKNDIDLLNDLAIFDRWIGEKIDHLDHEVYMITSTNDQLAKLSQKYGTDYFTWLGIVSFTEKEQNVGAKILLCLYPPLTPFMLFDLLTPDRSTFFFALVADAKTGKFKMEYFNSNKLNDKDAVQKSNIHYILQQIKTKSK